MSKSKEVSKSNIEYVRHLLKEGLERCEILYTQKNEDYMKPMSDVKIEAIKYLKENVEPFGLYKYSEKAMYGKGVEHAEECSIASQLYLETNHDESLPSILGDTIDA